MTRKQSRKKMLNLFYESEIHHDFSIERMSFFLENYVKNNQQKDFICEIYEFYLLNMPEIHNMIENSSENWKINRIGKIEISLIRMAISEILSIHTPTAVVFNEIIELAKEYTDEKSYKFMNGLMGKWAKENQGLIDEI